VKVAVLGWYGHGNCGDESYKISFPLLFPQHAFDFYDDYAAIDESKYDIIVLGGGDVIKPFYVNGLESSKLPWIAISVTVTPESSLNSLSKFSRVIVRDQRSLIIASNYRGSVEYLPDLCFALTANRENGLENLSKRATKLGHLLTDKKVGVVLNSHVAFNSMDAMARDRLLFERLLDTLAYIVENTDSSFVFLPFSTRPPWDDRAIGGWLSDRCKLRYYKNITIYDEMDVQSVLDVVAACDAMVSTRLHSSIFATIAGVPFVDVLHHDKNLGFIQTLGAESWATWVSNLEAEKVNYLLRAFLNESGHNEKLLHFTETAKEQLKHASLSLL
jgi:polysaccharide pyruvyl transferase WcaK-like protein